MVRDGREASEGAGDGVLPIALVVAVIAICCYWPSLQAGMVSDDFQFVRRPWGLDVLEHFSSGWEHQLGRATAYRPVTVFTYGLNQWLWPSPVGFHALNIAIHAMAAALLTLLASRLGLRPAFAGLCGVLFALHPIHAEAVSWISGRTASLGGMCAIGALWVMTYWAHGAVYVLLATVLAAASVLSYEGAFLLPVMLTALVWTDRQRTGKSPLPIRRLVTLLLPVAVVWLLYVVVRWSLISAPSADTWALSNQVSRDGFAPPMWARTINNLGDFVTRLLAAGWNLPVWQSRTSIVTVTLAIASVAVAHRAQWARRPLALAVVFGVVAYAPFASYTGYADRFAYLASISGACCSPWGLRSCTMRGAPGVPFLVSGAFVVMLALWTRQLLLAQADWVEARRDCGRHSTPGTAARSALPDGAHLHVVGVPLNVRGAYVFITYFDLAMRQALIEPMFASRWRQTRVRLPSDGAEPPVCLRWDAERRLMSLEGAAR